MKLNFKQDTIHRFSTKELEYGLKLLQEKLAPKLKELHKFKVPNKWAIERFEQLVTDPMKEKIAFVENELFERTLLETK